METIRRSIHRMNGRDPQEDGRVATPLELLYDLCYAVAFGIAGHQFANYFSQHSYFTALIGFSFAVYAICWAWIQFSWFASAFDTDDWPYRITVMVQMVGVVIVALGLPTAFASLHHGETLDIKVTVAGYVVIRLAQLVNWLRIYVQNPEYRPLCRRYVTTLVISQVVWTVVAFANLELSILVWLLPIVMVLETFGPIIGEGRGKGTPWHPEHIAERFSALAIITLGEGVVGTVASVNAAESAVAWTWEPVLLIITGLLLVFGMWWIYFSIPWGQLIALRPKRRFAFSYGHILVFGSIAATGASLQIAGNTLEHASAYVSPTLAVIVLACAVGIYVVTLFALYSVVTNSHDGFHSALIATTILVIVGGVGIVSLGFALPWGLLVISASPFVAVIGYETKGYARMSIS